MPNPKPTRRAPMTEAEARSNLASMEAETTENAKRLLLHVALGPLGNLTDEARAIYAAALAA